MYLSLNDAATNQDVETRHQDLLLPPVSFVDGYVAVYYATNPDFTGDGVFSVDPNFATHALLGRVAYRRDWQSLFGALQGEHWSPNGEARDLLKSRGIRHTSMSVGDVLVVKPPLGKKEAWMCASTGWRQLPNFTD